MKYFILRNNTQTGPFTVEELASQELKSDTLVWSEEMTDWTPAWKVEALRPLLGIQTPPPPPQSEPDPVPEEAVSAPERPTPQPAHEAVEETSHTHTISATPRKRGKAYVWWIVAAVILALLYIFNPTFDDHTTTITTRISQVLMGDSKDDGQPKSELSEVGGIFLNSLISNVMNTMLTYHNYVFFSTTTIQGKDGSNTVSFGILGYVFTANKQDIEKQMKKSGL